MSQVFALRTLIETCDAAISRRDFDALMAFTAISDYFDGQLEVTQGAMEVIEGADNALVIMETRLRYPDGQGGHIDENRRATYVFRKESDGEWRCTIDNSYGTALLAQQQPGDQPATTVSRDTHLFDSVNKTPV
ncbi:YybH family protein [Aeromonas rivipollensis]